MQKIALGVITSGSEYDCWFIDNILEPMKSNFNGLIILRGDDKDFASSKNLVIKKAEDDGFDWVFFMDTDEAMYQSDIDKVIEAIKSDTTDLIIQPRINFVMDTSHYDARVYPDWQGRVFKLNQGYRFRGNIHETLFKGNEEINWHTKNSGLWMWNSPIYHYGHLKPKSELDKKYWRKGEINNINTFNGKHPLHGKEIYK